MNEVAKVVWVNGPVVRARGSQQIGMLEVVSIGQEHLVAEVIGLEQDIITIQVYEETSGLHPGAPVYSTGLPLSVELGPGLLQSIFDGIQRPLPTLESLSGTFIGRGITTSPLDRERRWTFTPGVAAGDQVEGGSMLGTVQETPLIEHRIMVPPDLSGQLSWVASEGEYTLEEPIARLETENGEQELKMYQRWPVRRPRPYRRRLSPTKMLVTGQRVLDTLFPLAKGGAAAIPGGFGAGKCVTGDTPVLLGDGTLRPIAELYAEYEMQGRKIERGTESFTYLDDPLPLFSLEGGSLVRGYASAIYKGKSDQGIRITTRSGRTVKVTPVHRLFVVTPKMEIKEVEARSLRVGDALAAPRKLRLDGRIQAIRAPERGEGERRGTATRIPAELGVEFAEFLGLLLAGGQVDTDTIQFCPPNADEPVLSRFEELGRRLFGLEPHRGALHSAVLTRLMTRLGVPESGQREPRTGPIPEAILKSPQEIVARFLGAYSACAGSLSLDGGELEIGATGESTAIGLSYLLLRLGILHQRSSAKATGREACRIVIRGRDEIERFYAACSAAEAPLCTEKWGKDGEVLRAACPAMGSAQPERMACGASGSNYAYAGEKISTLSTKPFSQFITRSDSTQTYAFTDNPGEIFCDPIVEIETIAGPHDVYDVTVPGTHNFVGGEGPLVLHNTITQHQVAKWSDADIVVYIGCGERGNEMTGVLQEFPELTDPHSQHSLMERTILIANTSNMPVAAREASIYTGITLAEYYRDMGYDVALMADSTSRWAEALREISGRLEEMPAEEGYPAYLAARLAEFYERAGSVTALSNAQGSVTIIGAVSPPGGDFSEPVTQHTNRFIRCFWALDKSLASARHFPAINWLESYSEYAKEVADWWRERTQADWEGMRKKTLELLQREDHLQQIVKLVGPDALPDDQRLILETARLLREGFLQQNALDEVDSYATIGKQMRMLDIILHFYDRAARILAKGCPIVVISDLPIMNAMVRMKTNVPNDRVEEIDGIRQRLDEQLDEVEEMYS